MWTGALRKLYRDVLDDFYIDRIQALGALLYIEAYLIVVTDLIDKTTRMNENIAPAVIL